MQDGVDSQTGDTTDCRGDPGICMEYRRAESCAIITVKRSKGSRSKSEARGGCRETQGSGGGCSSRHNTPKECKTVGSEDGEIGSARGNQWSIADAREVVVGGRR